jgi:hypothetical protein
MEEVIDTNQSKKNRLTTYFEKARQDLIDVEQKRKAIIMNLAVNIEQEGLIPTQWICEEIVKALLGYGHVSRQYIRKCLDKRYKRKYEKKEIEYNAPKFVYGIKKVLDLVYGALVSKVNEEIRDEQIEKLTREVQAKRDVILWQERRIDELESQTRKKYEEEAANEQQDIKVPTTIWKELQSIEVSKQAYTNIVVQKGKFLRLEPIIANRDNGRVGGN